jgi:hypothetical protein
MSSGNTRFFLRKKILLMGLMLKKLEMKAL